MTKLAIYKLILFYSLQYGIDPKISYSVAKIESGMNPNIISVSGDIGLYQLNPDSFPNYTKSELLNPETNIKLGIKYLAKMKKECKYKKNVEWLVCYNAGVKYTRDNIKHPELFPYVQKVSAIIKGLENDNVK